MVKLSDGTVGAGESSLVDFLVEVPEGREPCILQLTDLQVTDALQARPGRTGVDREAWHPDKMEENVFACVRDLVAKEAPDLILITGDLVYGAFDDNGSVLLKVIAFMESLGVPWAPVFGNHDNESQIGANWQCRHLEEASNCLFLQRSLAGNGNYSVGISQGGRLLRVFFLLDSHGCGGMSQASLANGHPRRYEGFSQNQVHWYSSAIRHIYEQDPRTKISFAFHIQMAVWGEALRKYGFPRVGERGGLPIDLDAVGEEGDFGYVGSHMKCPWDKDGVIWKGLQELGVDSLFVGHEHANSASVVYEGIRLTYGLKTGLYDRVNYRLEDGRIVASFQQIGEPIHGGTAIHLGPEGEIAQIYHVPVSSHRSNKSLA